MCYFKPSELDRAATLTPGARVTLEGNFGGLVRGPSGLEVIFGGCKIKS